MMPYLSLARFLLKNVPKNLFQSAPKSSALTFSLDGDASINQWEVSQNAADDNSPLTCTPGINFNKNIKPVYSFTKVNI